MATDMSQAWIDQRATELKNSHTLPERAGVDGTFRLAGFKDVKHQTIPDPTPNPTSYTGRWFRDAKQLADFRAMEALLVHGRK
jgi:hypothetical protein